MSCFWSKDKNLYCNECLMFESVWLLLPLIGAHVLDQFSINIFKLKMKTSWICRVCIHLLTVADIREPFRGLDDYHINEMDICSCVQCFVFFSEFLLLLLSDLTPTLVHPLKTRLNASDELLFLFRTFWSVVTFPEAPPNPPLQHHRLQQLNPGHGCDMSPGHLTAAPGPGRPRPPVPVLANRGGSHGAPENTLAAIREVLQKDVFYRDETE